MHQPPTFEVDGTAIREERMCAGLEISEAAKAAGISRRYLSHLENGTRRRMRPSRYVALRAALNSNDDRLLAARAKIPKE
ncbi:helix-turn-helix transcriptional regulator [Streptomyces goshikiensis]|uniref:helix-turn-helix domain-containing protein n=1 Tax=Streptomyces goshikiensis TaxID=1942 RepID=UPI002E12C394|nr:helix-turn-helix domain-containing protein [Streptomyces goshikiensis]